VLFEIILYKTSIVLKWAFAASLVGSATYIAYQSMPTTRLRNKLQQCFEAGEIHLGSVKTRRIFPTIQAVKICNEKIDLIFTLPLGLDPKKILEKEWLFKQQFGENIELHQENKKFTLSVIHSNLPLVYKYNFEEIEPSIADLRLPIISGKNRTGLIAYDMVEHPHLLVAGETGSGKSTQLRSIITTLIKTKSPEELELYMADMKRSEFHLFKRVQHVKSIVNDAYLLSPVLKKLKAEMTRRGDLLDQHEVAHVDELPFQLPYIILCIDEVALLKKEKEIMAAIEDISAIGRALGVFLILSMQRPDADVLDGKLKNNLTVRMAFRHSDAINSRITIGSGDAAEIKLSERGRHFLKHEELKLVQGPYLSIPEAKKLLESFKKDKQEEITIQEECSEGQQEEIILGVLDDEIA